MSISDRIPVTIVTGFLGSGKTTLLNHLLALPALKETMVLINEFGEESLDHLLVQDIQDNVIVLESGCLCCTVRGDLVDALRQLFLQRTRAEIPWFKRLVIETTGMADPAPVLHILASDALIATRYHLDSVICTVDALTGQNALDTYPESMKQVAVADRLILTKTDLADPLETEMLRARLQHLAPGARLLTAGTTDIALEALFNIHPLSDPASSAERWIDASAYNSHAHDCITPNCMHHSHHTAGIHAEQNMNPLSLHQSLGAAPAAHHSPTVHSFILYYDAPLDSTALCQRLSMLLGIMGSQILRIKGILYTPTSPYPFALHAVQHMLYPLEALPHLQEDEKRSRLVFITDSLPQETVEELLTVARS